MVACGGSSSSDEESGDFGALSEESELRGRSLTVPSGGEKSFTFDSTGGAVAISVDCHPPANPDSVGPVFTVDAPDLNVSSTEENAGVFGWAGDLAEGSHTVTLKSVSGTARCTVKVGHPAGSSSCGTWKSRRSPNTNHTHFEVGTNTSSDWEDFPSSGNHWGAWSEWNKSYSRPVKRGFALHNLEHGGAVLSYKCSSNSSSECSDAESKLQELAESMNLTRYIITPDPDQPEKFAVRTWRMMFVSSCLNTTAAKSFITANIRNGREDIDADPPIPFDPTTTNVPCQDLMAAPDSCN
jgi:hypothetical protein